jgi:hypothetical protein
VAFAGGILRDVYTVRFPAPRLACRHGHGEMINAALRQHVAKGRPEARRVNDELGRPLAQRRLGKQGGDVTGEDGVARVLDPVGEHHRSLARSEPLSLRRAPHGQPFVVQEDERRGVVAAEVVQDQRVHGEAARLIRRRDADDAPAVRALDFCHSRPDHLRRARVGVAEIGDAPEQLLRLPLRGRSDQHLLAARNVVPSDPADRGRLADLPAGGHGDEGIFLVRSRVRREDFFLPLVGIADCSAKPLDRIEADDEAVQIVPEEGVKHRRSAASWRVPGSRPSPPGAVRRPP